MFSNKSNLATFAAVIWLLVAGRSEAQAPLGVRAQGMAGAFVGVADDASAVYWNPAGLATGAFVNFVLGYGRTEAVPSGLVSPEGGERQTGGILAFSAPPLGLAYYRLAEYVAGPRETAVTGVPGREEVWRSVHTLVTSNFGATLLQSLGDYVVVGATLKLVRGAVAHGHVGAIGAAEAVDQAGSLPRGGKTTGDVDLGAMIAVEHVRLGVVARNLTTPSFDLDDTGAEAVELDRAVRVGGAWGSGWPGMSRLVVAVDGDLTSRATAGGDRRDVAAGVESWWLGQRLGVRGGVRGSTVGDARSVVAAGVSAGLTPGIFLEAHAARGQDDERSWSVGARFTF